MRKALTFWAGVCKWWNYGEENEAAIVQCGLRYINRTRTIGGAIAPTVPQKKKKLFSLFAFSFQSWQVHHNDADTSALFVDHFTMPYCIIGRNHMWWVCATISLIPKYSHFIIGSFVRNKQYQKSNIIIMFYRHSSWHNFNCLEVGYQIEQYVKV